MRKFLISAVIIVLALLVAGGSWIYLNQKKQATRVEQHMVNKLKDKSAQNASETKSKNGKLVVIEPELDGKKVKYSPAVKVDAQEILTKAGSKKGSTAYLSFSVQQGPESFVAIKPAVKVYTRQKNQRLRLRQTVNLASQTVNQTNGHLLTLAELVPDDAAVRALNYQLIKQQADDHGLSITQLNELLNKNFLSETKTTNFSYSKEGLEISGVTLGAAEVAPFIAPQYILESDLVPTATGKFIALTFDDGPNPATTPAILKTLAEQQVKSTFFMVGTGASAYPALAKEVLEKGHEIGNHSYDHPQLNTLSPAQMTDQITRTNDAIYSATGKLPDFIRPPYGAVSTTVGATLPMPLIQWDIDTDDWATNDVAAIIDKVRASAHPGAIILMHDTHPQSVAALPGIISYLKQEGYEFKTVKELLGQKLLPGYQYFGQNDYRPA